MSLLAGVDIGGTKCAVCLGKTEGDDLRLIAKRRFPTPVSPQETIHRSLAELDGLLDLQQVRAGLQAIGISCGGPLDSRRGIVLSPPNLPGWDRIDVVTPLTAHFGVPVRLQNDANASALAEWKWGAGRGCRNMVFLTFGTGMGAGLILDGRLYSGTNDLAGEVGHIRLEPDGPLGYGKSGSFEGFCSGGGIADLARTLALEGIRRGDPPGFCQDAGDIPTITAETVGEAAQAGDPLAIRIFERVGEELGRALALLVDLINPERIIIGSIYARQQALLEPAAMRVLASEALPGSLEVCLVLPARLGESVGDLASLSVALWALEQVHPG